MLPSRVFLPKLESPTATVLEYLALRFPRVPVSTWRDRMARGLVTTDAGLTVREDSPYRHGVTVFYVKEVLSEPEPREIETILYQDDEIIVADKPHGMAVTPAGDHLARSLLCRLQKQRGIDELAPLHRLDRDTAGVVLFGVKPGSRAAYHELFAKRTVQREYVAAAPVPEVPDRKHWRVENRIEPGFPWFRQQIVEGPANAITEIELCDVHDGVGIFLLKPQTGKKHQLRLHMLSIGFAILGDVLYPELNEPQDLSPPLQLLARRLAFIDPLTGAERTFQSERSLSYPR